MNAIGTQKSKHQIQPEYGDMSRLTRDWTAEPVSRDQTLRHERRQCNIHFPVQLSPSRIGNLTRSILALALVSFYLYIYLFNSEMPLFPSIFWTTAVFSLYGEYVVRSFLPNNGVFLPCDHGRAGFLTSAYLLCEISIKSINQITYFDTG